MSFTIMSPLPGTHEIIELTESYDSESKNSGDTGKQCLGKPSKKHTIEDDINKLFEAIEIGSSRRGVGRPERHVRDALHKSAMKRPMRVGPSQASGIGISEPVSLKQALRGLCISQASEMAAVKKRMSRPSASPGISETGAIKKLYRAVVIESEGGQPLDEVKGNLVEISLVPERSLSNISDKAPESGHVSIAEVSERKRQPSVLSVKAPSQDAKIIKTRMEEDITPFPTNVGCELPKSESEQSRTLELPYSSVSTTLDKELSELDEIVPIPGESSKPSSGQHNERVDKLKSRSLSSNSNLETELIKISNEGFGLSEQSLRAQNIAKKKIVPKRTFVTKIRSQHNEGAKNDHDYRTSKIVLQTPDSVLEKGCEELEKVSPSSSSNANLVTSSTSLDSNASKHDRVPHTFSKTKSVVMKADERSRSREKGEFSQSSKSSIGEYSSTTSYSEESYLSGSSRSGYRPHMSKDLRWEAISSVQKQHGSLGMTHFKLLRKIGGGDIGTVYLSELIGTSCLFAVKVTDNEFLISRKKMQRAQTEKEILEILDHPFLPTLYAHFTTNKFSCLVMEYCPGGDLHVLRQKQLTRSFPEKAAR